MEQVAARVPEEIDEAIQAYSDENDCSRSEAIRDLLERGIEYDQLQTENQRLQNEKRTIIQQREQNTELVEYIEEEKSYRKAGLFTRAKWWAFGMPDD
ncbi:ribbon-helix-helix protein, CopG family [Natronococcus sp. A-GB7]|jgi:metal-responsive CopG/Arc/MetJ family transcriptional regulator|uniref:ribbon-helix-helix protein, CopG family n=1 Tax=Natronococcus sp. A-GB7 TaxID=3037649 RepID=UPI00241CEB77|nr:ribbon-helix-helix protein, CopG family [Natronococcus sp. A-GB7]MDG5821957.1 ribbon-helix-helix protein, CopG family [Natronococcus sp. A-GB7]